MAELDRLLQGYPVAVRKQAEPIRDRLTARQKKQAAYLAQLTSELEKLKGDPARGKEIFFSRKVGCYSCHRAVGKGGMIGPDLSQVGRFRSRRDLLESIVFPSSSIVPEFRSYRVTSQNGRVVSGIITRETTEAVYLRTSELTEVRISRKDVEQMTPSNVSLMPEGLEKTMSRRELSDLLAFLRQQR
jgi:putative heme-binding domain-containing protein